SGLEKKVEQRTHELTESLEQQTATSEVLGVISRSSGDLAPVFETILANATRICQAKFGVLLRYDGDAFHADAMLDVTPELEAYLRREPHHPGAGGGLEELVKTRQTVQVADAADFSGGGADPLRTAAVELGGVRTFVAVPMLKDGNLLGAIVIFRKEVRPFTEKQVELVTSFASQAVIAIENARLLSELRARTEELRQSVEELRALGERTQAGK